MRIAATYSGLVLLVALLLGALWELPGLLAGTIWPESISPLIAATVTLTIIAALGVLGGGLALLTRMGFMKG